MQANLPETIRTQTKEYKHDTFSKSSPLSATHHVGCNTSRGVQLFLSNDTYNRTIFVCWGFVESVGRSGGSECIEGWGHGTAQTAAGGSDDGYPKVVSVAH